MRCTLLAATVLLLTAGCGGGSDPETDGEQPTSAAPTSVAPSASSPTSPSPTGTTAAASTLVDYGEEGRMIKVARDVVTLEGVPQDFKSFLASDLDRQQRTKDEVCTEKPQIRVSRVDTRGWASGGSFIPQCGGSATLWARTGPADRQAWRTVWEGQTLPDCSVLDTYRFPAAVAGAECGTDDGSTRPYAR